MVSAAKSAELGLLTYLRIVSWETESKGVLRAQAAGSWGNNRHRSRVEGENGKEEANRSKASCGRILRCSH